MTGLFSVSSQYCNYGEYHANTVNKILHILGVPAILFSFLIIFACFPIPSPILSTGPFTLNIAGPVAVVLIVYYILLEPLAGTLLSAALIVMYAAGNHMAQEQGPGMALTVGIGVQVIGWGVQFIGHGVFEKRRPALTDNLLQVFIAPLFVTLEVLFMLGYKPQLQDEVDQEIQKRLTRLRRKAD